ncbi:probable RNA-binding protein EIF1AD [Clupea harengus]|uniref:Probable RNA-binding protein EIF1AD n=1 Tax=Clupea harengus TaxID=7950 RepID=A0A6P8F8B0_CLUHA|nr:probable RNA-binding protein EIF1AD [Clupea harengus]XP_031424759.1 probable RNA-binding protein EIF1AD [Clupea harengus]
MSQATKRKHVVKEALGDYVTPTENQQIVRVVSSPGNNLHEAATSEGERFLVSMPTKFRKNLWIKRGDFVIVDPIEEGDKVKGEISFILYRDNIHHLKKLGLWPKGFQDNPTSEERKNGEPRKDGGEEKEGECSENSESEEDDDSDLFVNTNHRTNYHYSESEDESEDEDEEKEEEEEGGKNSV